MSTTRRRLLKYIVPLGAVSFFYGKKASSSDSITNDSNGYSVGEDVMKNTNEEREKEFSQQKKQFLNDVRFFGSKGDGITDDSKSFHMAVEKFKRGVYVPEGVYFIPEDINGKFYGPGLRVKRSGGKDYIPFFNIPQSLGNVFLGYDAGKNYNGDDINGNMVSIGSGSCRNVSTGVNITAIGSGVLSGDTLNDALTDKGFNKGRELIGIGVNALKKSIDTNDCIGIGRDSLNENKHGQFNIAIGSSSLQQLHTGGGNVALGRAAGMRAGIITDSKGERLSFSVINGMTLIGNAAGREISHGENNTFIGGNSGRGITSEGNKFTGTVTASNNTSVGFGAHSSIQRGFCNLMLGANSGKDLSSGDGNIFIGYLSGHDIINSNGKLIISNDRDTPYIEGDMGRGESDKGLRLDDDFNPAQDVKYSLGKSNLRWSHIYCASGNISTSDGRLKSSIQSLNGSERRVALKLKGLVKKYKFNDAIESKGHDKARWHFGVIAQDVYDAFMSEGLDADDYGVFCYDSWEDEYAPIIKERQYYDVESQSYKAMKYESNEKILIKQAGGRYGIRYDELICFIISAI